MDKPPGAVWLNRLYRHDCWQPNVIYVLTQKVFSGETSAVMMPNCIAALLNSFDVLLIGHKEPHFGVIQSWRIRWVMASTNRKSAKCSPVWEHFRHNASTLLHIGQWLTFYSSYKDATAWISNGKTNKWLYFIIFRKTIFSCSLFIYRAYIFHNSH